RTKLKTKVAVAEQVVHAQFLGRRRSDPLDKFHLHVSWIEFKKVARIAVNSISNLFWSVPENFSPVVAHTSGAGRVIAAKIIEPQISTFQKLNFRVIKMVRIYITFCCRKVHL